MIDDEGSDADEGSSDEGDAAAEPVGSSPDESLPTPDPESTPPGRSRKTMVGVAVVVALLVLAVVLALVWPSDAGGYTDEVEANFMDACTADGGDGVEPVCVCLYTEIVENIDFDRFEEVNDALVAEQSSDPEATVQLPEDFDQIRATCVENVGPTVTVAPEIPETPETPDTETPDTGTPDTETPDTGTPDTETPDTGTPDPDEPIAETDNQ